MSWAPANLYNLVHLQLPSDRRQLKRSVYQQQWEAKKLTRSYHVPNITERQFLNRHFSSKIKLQHLPMKEMEKVPPVQSLAFAELERRLDVVVFRSHFAESIWDARYLVVKGKVGSVCVSVVDDVCLMLLLCMNSSCYECLIVLDSL